MDETTMDVGTADVTTTTESVDVAETTPSVDNTDTSSDVFVKVDPSTGERTVEFGESEQEVDTEEPSNVATEGVADDVPAQQYYSDSEFLKAYGENMVDPTRVSPDQMAQIQSARERELAYQQAVVEQQKRQQEREEVIARDRRANLGRIASESRMYALQKMGMTESDLQDLEFMEGGEEKLKQFNTLYGDIFSNLQYDMVMKEVELKHISETNYACRQEIDSFCEKERVSEPHFDEILQLMNTARTTMPYEKAVKIIQTEQNVSNETCTPNDLNVIREYYDECKKMVYQKYANVSKVPQRTSVPSVEKAGTPNVQAPPSINFKDLRGMSQYDRDKVIMNYISGQA